MFGLFNKNQKENKAIDMEKEIKRRRNQANAILLDLQSHKFRFTHHLERHAYNYTMRVSELRKRGHVIECEYHLPGVYKYTYKGFRPELRVV